MGTDEAGGSDAVSSETAATSGRALINRVIVGRYEVLEAVGEGPLLSAFRARDRQQNRIVAFKALRPLYANRADLAERLRGGFAETLSLNHPSIARGYDVGGDPGVCPLFYVEEYVRGIDLKERIRRAAPFQLTAATDIIIALAEALEYAHGRGVAHGDLRPQNVLIGPESQIKLSGFGAASAQSAVAAEDPTLLMKIAPYTAPDMASSSMPTASADLYALAVVAFEMLTGDTPFRGDNPIQIALRHAQEPAPSPRSLNQGVPRALEGIVLKGLAKRPMDRYRTASEMLVDLRMVRDALRFGRPLSWSPLDPPAESEKTVAATPSAPPVIPPAAPPMELPLQPLVTRASAPVSSTPIEAASIVPLASAPPKAAAMPANPPDDFREEPRRRSRGIGWLTTVNLLLGFCLLGAAGLVVTWMKPLLSPSSAVVVPNLVGKTEIEAKALAAERHFQLVVVDQQFRDDPPAGVIYAMKEAVGAQIREGKPISVWVSRGPEMVEVPEVRDSSLEKARRLLEKVGLKAGTITYEFHPIVPRGNILNQMPDTAERRPRGTAIDLVVSKGEEPMATPEPLPPIATAPPQPDPDTEDLKERNFKVPRTPYVVPSDNQQHRIRIDIEDASGTHTAYDEEHKPGDKVQTEVTAYGKSVTIRLYDNDVLAGTAQIK